MTPLDVSAKSTLDTALDATVVASLSAPGYHLRKRLWGWREPAPDDLGGRTILVTGATSGVGEAAAVMLARAGANVIVHGRNPDKVATSVVHASAGALGSVTGEVADLSSLHETAQLAQRVADRHERLHAVVSNAGVLLHDHTRTAEGVEATCAVLVLAPFLLVRALAARTDRVLTVASGGLYGQTLDVEQVEASPQGYRGAVAYARCKRAQLALTHQWQDRLALPARAIDPGWVDTPGLVEGLPGFHKVMRPVLRSAGQGADTLVWLAAQEHLSGTAQGLWRDRRARFEHLLPMTRYAGAEEGRLWDWCERRCAEVLETG